MDVAIIGGGPAACSAASWLDQLGLRVVLIEREPQLCATLQSLQFGQDWVLGAPGQNLATLGQQYARHLESLSAVQVLLRQSVTHVDWAAEQGWCLQLMDGRTLKARALLLATGLKPLRPEQYFPPGSPPKARLMDALSLTACRDHLPVGRILLLGGGDNAVENALFLQARGHQVTLWSRSDWRAQQSLIARLDAGRLTLRPRTPMPTRVIADEHGVAVQSQQFGDERFDHVAALLGFEAEASAWLLVGDALQRAGVTAPSHPFRDEPRFAPLGLFVAGDASGHQHPCVQTALGDGVVAAKAMETYLRPLGEGQPSPALRRNNRQIIHISGLRFGANLGVLDFEREGPQPIQVDAEVNLGAQMVVSRDADIGHVLDYRRVRAIIIDECTAEHTDLLEALLGKLCTRLMKLPGVAGVRIKVTKLEIFPDCQVAISAECGQW